MKLRIYMISMGYGLTWKLTLWRTEIPGLLCTDVQVVHWTTSGGIVCIIFCEWYQIVVPSITRIALSRTHRNLHRNKKHVWQCGLGVEFCAWFWSPWANVVYAKDSRCLKTLGWSEWQEVHQGEGLTCTLWRGAWLSTWSFSLCQRSHFPFLKTGGYLSNQTWWLDFEDHVCADYGWNTESGLWNLIAGLSQHACVILGSFLIYQMRILMI